MTAIDGGQTVALHLVGGDYEPISVLVPKAVAAELGRQLSTLLANNEAPAQPS